MRGVWRVRKAVAWLRERIADEVDAWSGYSQADVLSLKTKIKTALPGAVVWLDHGELNALNALHKKIEWREDLGISIWQSGTYKVVRSPHSRQRGVILHQV